MFLERIGEKIIEVSHKRIESPNQSIYFNHIHNHCELLLFLSGNAQYNIDGKIFSPSPYDLIFIPAATYHYLIPTSLAPYENYVIGIDVSMISKKLYKKLFSAPLMMNIEDRAELMGFFRRLDLYKDIYSDEDFSICAEALIRELLIFCGYEKDNQAEAHSGETTLIDDIIKYINENIERSLDAEKIAANMHLSVSYIQNLFSQKMRIGLKKYIMQKKIYCAHADIAKGMAPGEACNKYSFGDYSGFYRLYKKHFSTSPRNKIG